jgi:hypothetical protein
LYFSFYRSILKKNLFLSISGIIPRKLKKVVFLGSIGFQISFFFQKIANAKLLNINRRDRCCFIVYYFYYMWIFFSYWSNVAYTIGKRVQCCSILAAGSRRSGGFSTSGKAVAIHVVSDSNVQKRVSHRKITLFRHYST